MLKSYYVYIIAKHRRGALYVGITNNLKRRIYEHRNNLIEGFSKKYNIHNLVYYQETNDINVAILREKQLKKWKRFWKFRIIEEMNPHWEDLYEKI